MANITFDQPSTGTVNAVSIALAIKNNGTGGALDCTANSTTLAAIGANNNPGHGIWGESKGNGSGVVAVSNTGPGITAASNTGPGITAVSKAGAGLAGYFKGNVEVTGDIQLVNADCAEEFEVSGDVEPGTVMVINDRGTLESSRVSYDKKVAGIISGAGGFKPGIVLDKKEQKSGNTRMAVALLGKVYCKVDATLSSIEIGDLLTTSSTIGHAMKANDPLNAFGAIIGKALQPLKYGKGMIPVLVALQ